MKYTNRACAGRLSSFYRKWLYILLCILVMLSSAISVSAQEIDESNSDGIFDESIVIETVIDQEAFVQDGSKDILTPEVTEDYFANSVETEAGEETHGFSIDDGISVDFFAPGDSILPDDLFTSEESIAVSVEDPNEDDTIILLDDAGEDVLSNDESYQTDTVVEEDDLGNKTETVQSDHIIEDSTNTLSGDLNNNVIENEGEELAETQITPELEDFSFHEGYIRLKANTKVYHHANKQDLIGTTSTGSCVYAAKQDDSWLKVYFATIGKKNAGEDIYIAYVEESNVTFLDEDEQVSVERNLSGDPSTRSYHGHLIPLIEILNNEDETVEQEAVEVVDTSKDIFTQTASSETNIEETEEKVVESTEDNIVESTGGDTEENINEGTEENIEELVNSEIIVENEPDITEEATSEITLLSAGNNMTTMEASIPVDETPVVLMSTSPNSSLNLYYTRTGLRSVNLEWQSVPSADYYEVYIKDGESWRRKNKITETYVSYNYLSFGQDYQYKVRAHVNEDGTKSFTPFSDIVSVIITDMAPTLEATNVARKSVLLRWDGVENADYYEVYRTVGDSGSWSRNKIVYAETSSNFAINQDTQYQYKVRAHINTGGATYFGAFSSPISVLSSVTNITQFHAETSGFTSLNLSWDPTENCDYYEVYRQIDDNGTWTRNKKTTETVVEYTLSANKTYSFKVRAHIVLENDSFYTPFTDVAIISTAIPQIGEVSLENIGGNKYLLAWDAVDDTDYYEIYRLTDKNGLWRRNQVIYESALKEYTIGNGAFYGYKVRARLEKDGERVYTPFSDTVYIWNVSTPIIAADEITSEHMTISWEAISLADKYNIYIDGEFMDSCIDTTYTVDSTYTGSSITVSAALCVGGSEIESDQSDFINYVVPVIPNYRALVIGETTYSTRLNGPDNDMNFMSSMLGGFGYEVIAQQNATLDEIIDLIDIEFSGATENDVSLFYYSGHGVTGSTEYYSGALQTVDYQYISTMDLAELLSGIPGKVVVILDSCGSGATISDGTESTMSVQSSNYNMFMLDENEESENEELSFDAEQFNNGVINAFSSYDSVISKHSGSSRTGGPLKAGELKQTKFYVITGSAYEENSLTTQIDGIWGGVLTRGIASGTGCSYPGGTYSGAMPADADSDNGISFAELATYCRNYAGDRQHVLNYSASPNYILFTR